MSFLFSLIAFTGDAMSLWEKMHVRRARGAPALLARLNSTVLGLMDWLGVCNVARQARYLDAHLEQAIQVLLTGRCAAL